MASVFLAASLFGQPQSYQLQKKKAKAKASNPGKCDRIFRAGVLTFLTFLTSQRDERLRMGMHLAVGLKADLKHRFYKVQVFSFQIKWITQGCVCVCACHNTSFCDVPFNQPGGKKPSESVFKPCALFFSVGGEFMLMKNLQNSPREAAARERKSQQNPAQPKNANGMIRFPFHQQRFRAWFPSCA